MGYSWGRLTIAAGLFVTAFSACARAQMTAPVVPGYEQLQNSSKPADAASKGELLLGELNCTACHSAQSPRVERKGAPDLSDAGNRITPQYLRAFIADPHQTKPGTSMPDLLRQLDPAIRDQDVDALTHFLVSLGGPIAPSMMPANRRAIDDGRKLFHTVGCVACHSPEKQTDTKIPSVPLGPLGMKTTVEKLADFLLDPAKVRPAGRMPSLLLSRVEATDIALYLLRDQVTNPQTANAAPVRVSGVRYEFFSTKPDDAKLESFAQLKPSGTGLVPTFTADVPGHADEDFGLRLTSVISIPTAGRYRFFTSSDDGSRLYIDQKQIVDNDGDHDITEKGGGVTLTAGDHDITVTFYQAAGGFSLRVLWQGPGIKRQEIPATILFQTGNPLLPLKSETFVIDAQIARAGREIFETIGCAGCHILPNLKLENPGKALADLDMAAAGGCLSEHPAKGSAQYDLRPDQISAIETALKDKSALAQKPTPAEQVHHALAEMNCYACHDRDGIGGPAPDRANFFTMTSEFDMGDEGRLPPRLTRVGDKLLKSAIEQIVFEGKLHVRPVLATRMPIFSHDPLVNLPDALEEADAPAADAAPLFTEALAQDGRRLVGTKGMGCVNCHGVADAKSLGMPAMNLSSVYQRLRPSWFHRLLVNPAKVNPSTRMPSFWDHGDVAFKDLADGTMDGQIDAVWDYLSKGNTMALPIGLLPTKQYELVPTDQPIIQRTFVAPGLFVEGQIGTRAVLVGFPEMVHVAFDAGAVRLAVAWRGRFWDAGGQWGGRGGLALKPLGVDLLHMPDGPAFAILPTPNAPWPKVLPDARNIGGQFKGYVLDAQERPTFRYILNNVEIEEQPLPIVAKTASLLRKFHLASKQGVAGLMFIVADGGKIEQTSPGIWSVDGKYSVKPDSAGMTPTLRSDGKVRQLLLPITFQNGVADFGAEISW